MVKRVVVADQCVKDDVLLTVDDLEALLDGTEWINSVLGAAIHEQVPLEVLWSEEAWDRGRGQASLRDFLQGCVSLVEVNKLTSIHIDSAHCEASLDLAEHCKLVSQPPEERSRVEA